MGTAELQRLERSWVEPHGLAAWLGTVDHKKIGVRYLVTAAAFLVVTVLLLWAALP